MQVKDAMTAWVDLADPDMNARGAARKLREGMLAMADLARNGEDGRMVALQGISQPTGVPRQ